MGSNLRFYFHPKAEQDLEDALDWYADISPTLVQSFYDEFYRNIKVALEFPELFPIMYSCRKINMTRFPYLIFYKIKDDNLIVSAIFHGYRNPKSIRSAIKSR